MTRFPWLVEYMSKKISEVTLKRQKLVVLFAVLLTVASVLLSGCAGSTTPPPAQTTPTGTAATNAPAPAPVTVTSTVEVDKKYNVLSPRGVQLPVNISPLAARLTTFDGKDMWVTQAEADAVIMPALYDRLVKEYPKAIWHKTESAARGPKQLTADEQKTAAAVIQGIAW